MKPESPKTVALWMLDEFEKNNHLYQEKAVYEIRDKFSNDFTYNNENGNLAINKGVLKEFRELTGDNVIWERSERMWRERQQYDEPGGRQQD